MKKNEQKYINSLKEENERVKTLLMRFVDALGKLTNIDDVVNLSLIPLMTEQNKKFRAELKAEAYKEFAKRLRSKAKKTTITYVTDTSIQEYETGWIEISLKDFDNLLKEMVGEDK
jgi:hypothetical protein